MDGLASLEHYSLSLSLCEMLFYQVAVRFLIVPFLKDQFVDIDLDLVYMRLKLLSTYHIGMFDINYKY